MNESATFTAGNFDENENAAESSPLTSEAGDVTTATASTGPEKAINFVNGWRIPGVTEFALCLFFCKLVSYTFLYWLPSFIHDTGRISLHMSLPYSILLKDSRRKRRFSGFLKK